jgi:uncharacterized protein (DUF2164 family)
MGTTSKRYKGTKQGFGKEQVKELLYEEYFSQGIQFAMVHFEKQMDTTTDCQGLWHEIYAVVRNSRGQIFIMVVLVDIIDGEIYWKEMTENMGPSYYNCPIELFKWVPLDDSEEYAVSWRRECEIVNRKINRVEI